MPCSTTNQQKSLRVGRIKRGIFTPTIKQGLEEAEAYMNQWFNRSSVTLPS